MSKQAFILIGVLLVLAIILILSLTTTEDVTSQSRKRTPTPYLGVVTPGPSPTLDAEGAHQATAEAPLPTPSQLTDLAPNIPESDKATLIIRHQDGSRERVLLSLDMIDAFISRMPVGDTVVTMLPPLSLMGHQPPEPPTVTPQGGEPPLPSGRPVGPGMPVTPRLPTVVAPPPPTLRSLPSTSTAKSKEVPIRLLVTAGKVFPDTWSADSDILAYWTFTPEEVKVDYTYPPGTLNFLQESTGRTCQSPIKVGYPYSGNSPITWLSDQRVIIHTHDQFLEGTPCHNDFKQVTDQSQLPASVNPSASFSPSGRYLAVNENLSTPNLDARTLVSDAKTNRVEQEIKWRHLDSEGPLPAPIWLNDNQFLIQSTLDRGPLLVTVGQEAIEVAPTLFGRPSKVECTDTPCDASLAAKAAALKGTSTYHIALYAIGHVSSFSKVLLYHSENERVEELPFQEFGDFSPDGQALIGYEEGYRAWMRAVDPVGSDAHLFLAQPANLFPVRWSPDGNLLAVSSSNGISIFSVPDGTRIGFWDTGGYSVFPAVWSPNNKLLAVQGYLPNGGEEALFVVYTP